MIYIFIEKLSRRIMEWAIKHQPDNTCIIDDVNLIYKLRTSKIKEILS